jgi:hypothetical protein
VNEERILLREEQQLPFDIRDGHDRPLGMQDIALGSFASGFSWPWS